MLPQATSIWQRDSQPNASGRPGAIHCWNSGEHVKCRHLRLLVGQKGVTRKVPFEGGPALREQIIRH